MKKLKSRLRKMMRLDAEGDKLWSEGSRLEAKHRYGDNLKAKANVLYNQSNKLYYAATKEEQEQIKKYFW